MARLKKPTDYPQLAFRISNDDKANINALADEVLSASNQNLQPDEKQFRKNDVLVDALYLGLITLKNNRQKLTRF